MGSCKAHKSRIFAWIAIISILTSMFAVGSVYARRIDWASSEYVFSPADHVSYTSDCLVEGGQRILLADWKSEDVQREIPILIGRPVPETLPTETTLVPTTTEPTATESTEAVPSETITVPTVETEAVETVPTESEPAPTETETVTAPDLWPDAEAVILPDQNAAMYFDCGVVVDEYEIRLVITRNAEPLPEEAVTVSVNVSWNGLEATFIMNIRPETADSDQITETERQVVTGLTLIEVFDTIHPEKPVTCLKLNLQTLSDFSISFIQGDISLNKVRWSLDGGNTYTMLYDTNVLSLTYPYPEGWDGTVFVDFGLCLKTDERPIISVNATGYALEEYKPLQQPLPVPETQLVKASELPAILPMDSKWGAASAKLLDIERLIPDETGKLTYQADPSMVAKMEREGLLIEPAAHDRMPQPGSYRLRIQWIWKETVIEDQIVYFFVNTN